MMKIGHRVKPAGMQTTDFPGGMTDILNHGHIGGAKKIGQTNQHKMLQPLGHALAKNHAPGSQAIFNRQ